MAHIMSAEEINAVRDSLSTYFTKVQEGKNALDTVIKAFESDPTVQSFFVSGNFGKENQERLIKLRQAMDKFESSIGGDGGLYNVTNRFLKEQEDRLNRGV